MNQCNSKPLQDIVPLKGTHQVILKLYVSEFFFSAEQSKVLSRKLVAWMHLLKAIFNLK